MPPGRARPRRLLTVTDGQEAVSSSTVGNTSQIVTLTGWYNSASWPNQATVFQLGSAWQDTNSLFVKADGGILQFHAFGTGGARRFDYCETLPPTSANTLITVIFDATANAGNGGFTLYYNTSLQTLVNAQNDRDNSAAVNGILHVGATTSGTVDDVRIYNTALSGGDISTLHGEGPQ